MNRFVVTAVLLLAANSSDDHLEQLARSGNIQESAPVKASLEIVVNAPPEKVWQLLTDVKNWPRWERDIKRAEISGPLQSGTSFSWNAGADIRSRIALVQPLEQFVWTGTAYRARAIHVWKLQSLPGNRTLVKMTESMDGPLLTLFFSSSKLTASDQRWLNDLKAAAEQS